MRLTLQQKELLVQLIKKDIPLGELSALTLNRLNLDLSAIAPAGDYEERIRALIKELQTKGKSGDLLHAIEQDHTTPNITRTLGKIKKTHYTSPTNKVTDAILLGSKAFVNRDKLRQHLRDFSHADPFSARVILISGEPVTGKTHSWLLIRHLATQIGNARPVCVGLNQLSPCEPLQLMERIRRVLSLSKQDWPELADSPQDSQISTQLVDWFIGRLPEIETPVWLVIDDLNGDSPTHETRELVVDLAVRVQQQCPDNFWLVLVGVSQQISNPVMYDMLFEEAYAPGREDVRKFFKLLAEAYDQSPPDEHLERFVDEVFGPLQPPLNHEQLEKVNRSIERVSAGIKEAGGFPL